MRNILLLIFLSFSTPIFAQKLAVDKMDDFTGKVEKQSSYEVIFNDFSSTLRIKTMLVDTSEYIAIKMVVSKSSYYINESDLLQIKTSDGLIYNFYAIKSCYSGVGQGAVGLNQSGVMGIEATYKGALSCLKNVDIIKIRVNTSEGYKDFDISKKKSATINNLISLLR